MIWFMQNGASLDNVHETISRKGHGNAEWLPTKGVARGWAQRARPPSIEMLFQIFRLNFSWDMSKMHYFSNKFSKIAKCWELSASSAP